MSQEDDSGTYGVLVHAIKKNATSEIRISYSEFEGHDYIDIREFFTTAQGELRPTRKGVTLPIRAYPELLRGVLELGGTLGFLDLASLEALSEQQDPPDADQEPILGL